MTIFIFPVADGTVKICGGDQDLRTPTSMRDSPDRGEEQDNFRGESDGFSSPNPLQDGSKRVDAEARNDFWSITGEFIYHHHVVKLYLPKEESFPVPLKYIDFTRTTHASLVKTTPQKTRFRDVKYARIWDTD